jgi:hypothetical protein
MNPSSVQPEASNSPRIQSPSGQAEIPVLPGTNIPTFQPEASNSGTAPSPP